MSVEPPPLNPMVDEDEDDDDDLFKSAISGPTPALQVKSQAHEDEDSSGYHTHAAMERSDTLEDVNLNEDSGSSPEKVEILATASPGPVEPEPSKKLGVDLAQIRLSEHEIGASPDVSREASQEPEHFGHDDDDDEEEEDNPFHDTHLNLSGAVGSRSQVENGPTHERSNGGQVNGSNGAQSNVMEPLDPTEMDELEGGDDFIQVSVTEPHKVGDGMTSYMVYKVSTKTSFNFFRSKELSVNRRFSDFLGLHDKLSEKYLQNGRIIPPAPGKSVIGMTKLKMTAKDGGANGEDLSTPQNPNNDEFVERRRAALERYLNRTVAHPSLRADPDLREFLELPTELPKSNQTSTLSGKNVMRFISKSVDRVTNMTLKMEETDEWFEEKNHSIEQLDQHLRKLHSATESLHEYRRTLAYHTGVLSKSLAVLSGLEENTELSGALAHLSGVQEKVEHVHGEQASADFYLLSELIKDYIGLVGAVKDVFQERIKAWQHWQNASVALTKKREAKAKAELQGRQDRVAVLREEIVDQERQQDMAQENFKTISRLIKKEVEQFDVRKAQDFKKGIIGYLQVMLKSQEDISKHWEQYLPEIKQISHN
ncbi:hypothetical protein TCAL_10147 [Tigriopus californicus]|uniref:PX domain-containing protein n=1 Tax=Tigriopus californicus TaxID=6832 RepID=A0A553PGX0_TIGCA|nr:sorting nexin-2-like [Tigriopus californicus]TRY76925.1 hypothetical protein TCAL_10147 [Tigriopus californicus]